MKNSRGVKQPEFLCMGFQKCGTTTLFEILEQHKDVVLCRDVKEPMYYRVLGLHMIGHKWYYLKRYFNHVSADDKRVCGEVNAGLTFTGCAKKICHDFSPDTKLIFMMRNPVDRTYSSYKYFLTRGFLPNGQVEEDQKYGHAEAFDRYVHSILDDPRQESQIMKKRMKYLVFSQSRYYSCIKEYLGHFPMNNIHLVFFEEFVRDQKESCRDIFDFIGISQDDNLNYYIRANEGNQRAVSSNAAERFKIVKGCCIYGLYEFLAMNYWAPGLYRILKRYYDNTKKKCLVPDGDKSKMLPETRQYLEKYFAREVVGIEQLSGRSLDDLWYPASGYVSDIQYRKAG